MNILIVSQYFKPETFIINDLALELEKQGHHITVLTGKPNYPDGKIFAGYNISTVDHETHGNEIEVIRVPMVPRKQGRAVQLALNYLSFAFSATLLGPWLLRKKKFDFIFVFTVSPITVAFPAQWIGFIKRIPVCLWVQDLWPESLVATNYIKNKYLIGLVRLMVRFIYKHSDLVMVQSKSFFEPIRKIFSGAVLEYYPNSFKVTDQATDASKYASVPTDLVNLLKDNFSIVFGGNIGKVQSVETIVEAAKLLREEKQLKIVFVGSGSRLQWIEEQIQQHGLTNVVCAGRFEPAAMPTILSNCKATFLTLNAGDILTYTLPWKTQSYLSSAKPIIGAIDGEGALVITEARCGFCGPAENVRELAANIKRAMQLSEKELEQLGTNGYQYFLSHFEMETQARQLIDIVRRNTKLQGQHVFRGLE